MLPLARSIAPLFAVAALALAAPGALAQSHGGHGGWSGGGHGGHGGWSGGGHWHGGHRGGGSGHGWGRVGIGVGIGVGPWWYDPWWYPGYVVAAPAYPVAVVPPAAAVAPPAPAAPDPVIYPRNGQSPQQTEVDRRDCDRWAMTQPRAMADASVFHRAAMACMEGRGYTVR